MGVDAQMFVKVNREVTEHELKAVSYLFGSSFKYSLMIGYKDKFYHKPLERILIYQQDGPDIVPEEGQTFLEIYPRERYWGPGYERGPLMDYVAMAIFLENLIPNCEVWYGGDSSGVNAIHFDEKTRNEYIKHFIASKGHDAYSRFFDREKDGMPCPHCEVKMIRNGWGPNYKAWFCHGCGLSRTEQNGIITQSFGAE